MGMAASIRVVDVSASPTISRILAALARQGALTRKELAAAGLSSNTVKNAGYLDALLVQERIHIDSWQRRRRGAPRPFYMAGPGVSAPPPLGAQPARKIVCISPAPSGRGCGRQPHRAVQALRILPSRLRQLLKPDCG